MRLTEKLRVHNTQRDLVTMLRDFQDERDLTTLEMTQGIADWLKGALPAAIRTERGESETVDPPGRFFLTGKEDE